VETFSETDPTSLALERHYKPSELAALWNFSEKVIRETFLNEPQVAPKDVPAERLT
jgi:hypothetical protein